MNTMLARIIKRIFQGCCASLALLLLAACVPTDSGQIVYVPAPPPEPEVEEEPAPAGPDFATVARMRIIADMLYEARNAYEDNRLTQPSGNNAYDRYQQVLNYDPGNEVALSGIRQIAERYVELAEASIAIGQFDSADNQLRRATQINRDNPRIATTRQRLDEARKSKLDFYALDPEGLRAKSLEIMVQLAEIGQLVMRENATFLITARSDEEARWIYQVMREAVGGFRLRGNIALGNPPGIQLNATP